MQAIDELLEIMRTLRDPRRGCAWVRQQTMNSILPFTLEETYELLAAVETDDSAGIRSELGDLLYHLVYYAEMARETGRFDFESVVRDACEKVTRRHPHVFGGPGQAAGGDPQAGTWERLKREERRWQEDGGEGDLLAGLTGALPALIAALKIQKRVAAVGFDWPEPAAAVDKIEEELREVRGEIENGAEVERIDEEIGDLLFSCVNVARHTGVDPELALWRANRKFRRRFRYIESALKDRRRNLDEATLEEMDSLWQAAKAAGY